MAMDGIRKGNKKTHTPKCYATGGRVPEDISEGALPMDGDPGSFDYGMEADGGMAGTRMDRPSKKSAPVNVNIIVNSGKSPQPDAPMPPPLPPMAGPPGPMPPPPGPPAGLGAMGGPPPPPGMPMRKDGGRINSPKDAVDMGIKDGIGLAKKAAAISPAAGLMAVKGFADPKGLGTAVAKAGYRAEARKIEDEKSKPERASGGRVGTTSGETGVAAADKWMGKQRATGGRVMEGGAGGGLGRLEKAKDAK